MSFLENSKSQSTSQQLHDKGYQKRKGQGLTGWESEFNPHDLDVLMASRYAPSAGRLLDLGCGGGETSVYFAQRGFDVTALEFSPTALSMAENNAQAANAQIAFIEADMSKPLPIESGAFDVLVDHRAFHCVVGLDTRAAALVEFHRVLKTGGFFFSSTIAGLPRDDALLDTVNTDTRINRARTRYFGEVQDILGEFRTAGFDVLGYQVLVSPFVVDNLIVYAQGS